MLRSGSGGGKEPGDQRRSTGRLSGQLTGRRVYAPGHPCRRGSCWSRGEIGTGKPPPLAPGRREEACEVGTERPTRGGAGDEVEEGFRVAGGGTDGEPNPARSVSPETPPSAASSEGPGDPCLDHRAHRAVAERGDHDHVEVPWTLSPSTGAIPLTRRTREWMRVSVSWREGLPTTGTGSVNRRYS